MFHRVLVLLGHPDSRDLALEHALRLLAVGGELHLMMSCTAPLARHLPPPALSSPLLIEAIEKEMYRCHTVLERNRTSVRARRPDLSVRLHVESGRTAELVLRLAEQLSVDLLVISGDPQQQTLWESFFGGPAEKLLRGLNRPLLILPDSLSQSPTTTGKETYDYSHSQKA